MASCECYSLGMAAVESASFLKQAPIDGRCIELEGRCPCGRWHGRYGFEIALEEAFPLLSEQDFDALIDALAADGKEDARGYVLELVSGSIAGSAASTTDESYEADALFAALEYEVFRHDLEAA